MVQLAIEENGFLIKIAQASSTGINAFLKQLRKEGGLYDLSGKLCLINADGDKEYIY